METVENVINQTNIQILLKIGRQVCPKAPAVQHWFNKSEPKYFMNPETLREALCQAWQTGDYKTKRTILLAIDGE